MWILLSMSGALFQAVEMAIKKKALQTKGLNSTIAFVAFTFAGIILSAIYFFKNGGIWPAHELSGKFWNGMFWYFSLNVVATWFLYKALDIAQLNYLMPFMTLTSLSIIIPPIFVFGEIPTPLSFIGICLIVAGVLFMDRGKLSRVASEQERETARNNRHGKIYFLLTAVCYTITPTAAKVAIKESSPLFVSFLVHLLIGLSFLFFIFIFKERARIKELIRDKNSGNFLGATLLAGATIAAGNLAINFALNTAPVSYVMAIKRLMPFFAFIIGYFYFKERTEVRRKTFATALMVLGAALITIFGQK